MLRFKQFARIVKAYLHFFPESAQTRTVMYQTRLALYSSVHAITSAIASNCCPLSLRIITFAAAESIARSLSNKLDFTQHIFRLYTAILTFSAKPGRLFPFPSYLDVAHPSSPASVDGISRDLRVSFKASGHIECLLSWHARSLLPLFMHPYNLTKDHRTPVAAYWCKPNQRRLSPLCSC